MTGRNALTVSRPIRPVILIGGRSSAQARRSGLALIWRRQGRGQSPPTPGHRPPAGWSLTINLFFKAAAGLSARAFGAPSSSRRHQVDSSPRPRPAGLFWRAPPALRIERQAEVLSSILKRMIQPEIASVERWRTLIHDFDPAGRRTRSVRAMPLRPPPMLRSSPRAREAQVRSNLPHGFDQGPEALAVALPAWSRSLRSLAGPAPKRRAPRVQAVTRVAARRVSSAAPRRNRLVRSPTPDGRRLERTVVQPWRVVERFWRQEHGASAARPVHSTRERPAVELIWASRKLDGPASLGPLGVPPSLSPMVAREVTTDSMSLRSVAGQGPAGPPDVDRLVDEVFRRMDRQLRNERLRRGI